MGPDKIETWSKIAVEPIELKHVWAVKSSSISTVTAPATTLCTPNSSRGHLACSCLRLLVVPDVMCVAPMFAVTMQHDAYLNAGVSGKRGASSCRSSMYCACRLRDMTSADVGAVTTTSAPYVYAFPNAHARQQPACGMPEAQPALTSHSR